MPLLQLAYVSRPVRFDAVTLISILTTARAKNARLEITGSLVCRSDFYAQLIEGPEEAVRPIFALIEKDLRHFQVTVKVLRRVDRRMFRDWAMHDDPARSWMWSRAEVASGALERATAPEIVALFERVRVEADF